MELIVGDRIIYESSQYFITYIIKNSGSTIYRARDTMNNEIRLSETEIQNVEIDEKYGIIIRGMHEIMDQHVMTDNYNYIYRYGIQNNKLYRLISFVSPFTTWNEKSIIAHTFPEEVYESISFDENKYVLADHRIFWIRAGKYCNGKTLEEIKKYMIAHPHLALTKKPERKNNNDFVISVHRPVFQRYTGNENENTFDNVRLEIILREQNNMMQQCIEHKKEILDAAVDKLKSSKSFRKYGVPVNFLKVYDMVLTKDNCIILSLCLKELNNETS